MGCSPSIQPEINAVGDENSNSVDRSRSLSESRQTSSTNWKSRVSRVVAVKMYTEEGSLPQNPADIMVDLRTYLDEPLLLCRFGKYVKDHGYDSVLLCWAAVQEFRPLIESDYRNAQFIFIFDKYLSDATESGDCTKLPSLGIEVDSSYFQFLFSIAQDIRSNCCRSQQLVSSYASTETPSFNQPEMEGADESLCDSHNFDVLQQQCLRLLCDAVFGKFKRTMQYYISLKDLKNQYNRVVTEDFEYMEKLGQGSYGFVVHCRKKSTRKHYAMKIQTKVGLLDCFNDAPERVVFEKDAVASCSHPFIVGLDYSFQTTTLAIMVTTLGTGGTLGDAAMCCPNNKMPLERVKFYSAEIVLALIHIHRMKLIYRDLKPSNVLLNLDGHIQLVDLGGIVDVGGKTLGYHGEGDEAAAGLFAVDYAANQPPEASMSMSSSNTKPILREGTTTMGGATFKQKYRLAERPGITQRAKSIMGTGGYMAPEMLAMLQDDSLSGYTHAVDYWSLGVTMYKLISGSLPFHDSHVNMFCDFLASSLASPLPQSEDTISQPVGKHPAYIAFERRLRSDPRMTEATIDILLGFLEVEEKKRLGYGKRGYRRIKQHVFFHEYDWNLFPSKQIEPPIVETLASAYAPLEEEFGMPSSDSADESELTRVTNFTDMMSTFGKESWLTLAPQNCEQQYFQNWDFISPQILKYEMGLNEEQQAMAAAQTSLLKTPIKNSFMSNQLNRISYLLHIGGDATQNPDSIGNESLDSASNQLSKSTPHKYSSSKDQSPAVILNELFGNSTDGVVQSNNAPSISSS